MPVAAKLQRQPTFSRSMPISGTPIADANFAEPSKMEAAQVGRNGGSKRGDAPDKGADASHPAHAKSIQHHPDRKLAQRIGPVVSSGKITELNIRNGEGGDQRRMG